MLIKEKALIHWVNNFYGYGSWDARIWFIAHEEGSGDMPQEVADKLNYFHKIHAPEKPGMLCDIRELYRQVSFSLNGPRADLFKNLFEYRFGSHAVQHGTWKNLIAFVFGFANIPAPDLLEYQKKSLASASKNSEALLRLYPLPAHNHAWYYSWLDLPHLTYLQSRAAYQQHVYKDRIQVILNNVGVYKPEVVVMYGMENINTLKKSVQEFYPAVKFKMSKAIKGKIPMYHRADLPDTTLILTTQIPALRHNRIETGFDWNAFGEKLSSG
ncbi:MAG: hypothetical protein HC811_06155 [Flammeovirgaceae bacterium]|nr:hypothetical protein [Flammeovirgaceae bacterium]